MGFGEIKHIIEEKDYKEHSDRIRKDVLKMRKYLLSPRTLNQRKLISLFRFLSKNAERKILTKHINDLQFLLIHIVEKPKENRFNDLKKYYGLKDEDIEMIKFIMFPDKFPPGGYEEKLKKYGIELYTPKVIFKKLPFKDYIDLYALMTYIPLDEKNIFIQNLLDEILKLNPLEDKNATLKRFLEIYKSLSDFEQHLLNLQLRSFSYYHYRLFNVSGIKGMVIDGSNVVRYENKNSLQFLLGIIENLYTEKYVFYPVHIVFDKNIEYILEEEERKILKNFLLKKRVYLYSPADEKIIEIAKKYGYFVLSNDKFKEYDFDKEKILEIKRFI
ncbi:hypothetical protein XO10_08340 [Marinitoga sp. 1135]|uniref:hypothetical protein n=1 Tax=unclassified Marinitoga TaxID=2640159 RepID=UPI00095083F2|nr:MULTISPECIES: hypothetical protein [unclassified Marinitoga]APT76501.1 hypothetical protein LN42_09025 [Marinitoga sp. 1137]NUU96268.1 hypothetical protein [Marinitoga sp. 1135]